MNQNILIWHIQAPLSWHVMTVKVRWKQVHCSDQVTRQTEELEGQINRYLQIKLFSAWILEHQNSFVMVKYHWSWQSSKLISKAKNSICCNTQWNATVSAIPGPTPSSPKHFSAWSLASLSLPVPLQLIIKRRLTTYSLPQLLQRNSINACSESQLGQKQ